MNGTKNEVRRQYAGFSWPLTDANPGEARKKLLVVDSQPLHHQPLIEHLRARFQTELQLHAPHGPVADTAHCAMVIISGDGMPPTGMERSVGVDPAAPLVAVLGRTEATLRLRWFQLGAADVVTLPTTWSDTWGDELCARIEAQVSHGEDRRSPVMANVRDPLVLAAMSMLDASTCTSVPTPLSEVAHSVGLTLRALNQRFVKATGMTAGRFVSERRMELARTLLAHTNRPIQDIAFDLGYAHPANFATAFRERFGVTPRTWRATMTHAAAAANDPQLS